MKAQFRERRPKFVRSLVLSFFVMMIGAPAKAAAPAQLEAAMKRTLGDQPGGIAVAYVDAEGVTFANVSNPDAAATAQISPDSIFEIGSVTKVFTSLLFAESERTGKVNREDPISNYLKPSGIDLKSLEKITLVSLATHSSGLPRMPLNQPEAGGPHPYESYTSVRLLEGLALSGPSAAAGNATAYSNFGVALLGEALGVAWQQSYADALSERVIRPLGLTHTTLGLTGSATPAEMVTGHAGAQRIEHWKFQAMAPAGAIRSSTRDLALFLQACLGLRETPLASALTETFKPIRKMDAPPGQIGLAWMLMENGGQRLIWHNGATGGFRAFVGFIPATKSGVVVLASNSALNLDALGLQLLKVKPTPPVLAAVADAGAYKGSYSFSADVSIVVTERRGALFVQMTAQPPLALKEKSTDRFSVVDVPAEVSFERNAAGRVESLVLHQNGLDQRAPRTVEITLSPEKAAEYAGVFALTPAVAITMTVENGALFTQLTGQPKFPMFASGPNNFFLKVVNARVRFERDASGQVVAVVLIQNGREQRAPKQP